MVFGTLQNRFRSACTEGRTLAALKCIEAKEATSCTGAGLLDINKPDLYGHAAIHYACRDGHIDTAILLLAHGALSNLQGIDGQSPLMWAARYGHMSICLMLLSRGADPALRDKTNSTWMDKFGVDRYAPPMSATQKEDIDENARQELFENDSPLHTASRFVCLDLCLLLISRGADPNEKNARNQTPTDVFGHGRLLQFLPPLGRGKRIQAVSKMQTARIAFVRKLNWQRRRSFLMFVVAQGFRPFAVRMAAAAALVDPSARSIEPTDISTPEKYRLYLVGQVFSNEAFVRLLAAFL